MCKHLGPDWMLFPCHCHPCNILHLYYTSLNPNTCHRVVFRFLSTCNLCLATGFNPVVKYAWHPGCNTLVLKWRAQPFQYTCTDFTTTQSAQACGFSIQMHFHAINDNLHKIICKNDISSSIVIHHSEDNLQGLTRGSDV